MSYHLSDHHFNFRNCTCCNPPRFFINRKTYHSHINRDKINTERKMKRSSNNISNPSNTNNTVSVDPGTPVDRSVSLSVNQLIKSTTLLVEVNVDSDIIYKKLKGIVSSNRGKSQAIKEHFKEKKDNLKNSK
jgi:hypothetical protein